MVVIEVYTDIGRIHLTKSPRGGGLSNDHYCQRDSYKEYLSSKKSYKNEKGVLAILRNLRNSILIDRALALMGK